MNQPQPPASTYEKTGRRIVDLAQEGRAATVTILKLDGEIMLITASGKVERLGRENSDIDKNQ